MKTPDYEQAIQGILERDGSYHREAYEFVRESLTATVEKLKKPQKGPQKHITARELMDGMRECALENFGQMAFTVLREWGVESTLDFGRIVFNLVDAGLLRKSDEDKVEDFIDGFDLHEALRAPFEPKCALKK